MVDKMGLIELHSIGTLSKTIKYLQWVHKYSPVAILEKYGKLGVDALQAMTPQDTGLTSNSWYYVIEKEGDDITLTWCNSNVNDGCNVAILLQFGHGTKSGTYVSGLDYINPALKPIFENIYSNICQEVSSK